MYVSMGTSTIYMYMYMYVNKDESPYSNSNYSVVSFPHYSSSTVVLIIIGIHCSCTSIEHHNSEMVITNYYTMLTVELR